MLSSINFHNQSGKRRYKIDNIVANRCLTFELETGKTYTGKASISGGTLSVAGCILGGLLCRSENWVRQ